MAVARYQRVYLKKPQSEVDPRVMERGEKALDRLESALTGRDWLVGSRLSVADVALAPYTRLAHEGGFDLGARSAVRGWIARCEGILNFP